LAELYARGFDPYAATPGATYAKGDVRAERQALVRESAIHLRQHFHEVPVLVVPVSEGRVPATDAPGFLQASYWGSIVPAVWSFMLAARARGLGTALTTLHLLHEREAAELLGIPYEQTMQVGLIPVAYTKGPGFKPAKRLPPSHVTHWNRW
jgi:nitroreductase